MKRILDVYLKEALVGFLEQTISGELTFTYDSGYLNKGIHPVSISMPLRAEPFNGPIVKSFFSGLLPDESVRERLANYLGLSKKNPFALLEVIGGDCAGALALYPHNEKQFQAIDDSEVLDDARLAEVLNLIKSRPMLAGDDGYRLSLAGAQDKLAIGFSDNKVHLIKGGMPTTHILKPAIGHVEDSVYNELFCIRLSKMLDIEAPNAFVHFVGDTPCYIIERYDRTIDENGVVQRIHQEDFCQALGIAPEIKYEREGGPSLSSCQKLISDYSFNPSADKIKLIDIVLFNYLIGNSDAHGKNFSFLYRLEKPELAPAYDILSTAVYPNLCEKMAMKIGGKYKPRDVNLRYLYRIVANTSVAKSTIDKSIEKLTSRILSAANTLKLQLEKEGVNSDVYEKIINVISERLRNFR